VRAAHILPAIAPVGTHPPDIVTAVEPIPLERAMIAASPSRILAEVTPVGAEANEVAVAPVATNGAPVANQDVAITLKIAPVVTNVSRVRPNVAAVRPDVTRVVPHFLSGRRNGALRRRCGRKPNCHRGAKRHYS
jgi:hypothetical protein